MQKIICGENCYKQIGELLKQLGVKKYMLVCRPSFFKMGLNEYFADIETRAVYFTDFTIYIVLTVSVCDFCAICI